MPAAADSVCHFAPLFAGQDVRKTPRLPVGPEGFPGLPKDWTAEFETFQNGKAHLFAHLFRAQTAAPELRKKALVVLHGQGENSGRYLHWPHYLKSDVGSIYALDHQGHGQSSGIRGHIDHIDDYAHDAAAAIERYRRYLDQREGSSEIHLAAHSMGGLIALRLLQLYPKLPIKSATLSAPMLALAFSVPKIKTMAARVLLKTLPKLALPTAPLGDWISSDPHVRAHYKADPLNHGLASASFFHSFQETSAQVFAEADRFQHPLLIMIPTADKIIDPETTKRLFAAIKAPEKKELILEDFWHEIFNEPGKDKAFQALSAWIEAHSS